MRLLSAMLCIGLSVPCAVMALDLPADIVPFAQPRMPTDVAASDFVTPASLGLAALEDEGIDLYLPSLTIVDSGAVLRKHATLYKIKARYKVTGTVTERLCASKPFYNCQPHALIEAGAPVFKTRYPFGPRSQDIWCTTAAPAKCVYSEDIGFGNTKDVAAWNHPAASPFSPRLKSADDTTHPGFIFNAASPLKVREEPVDFGGDMIIAVLFEDFDSREVDLRVITYGLGGVSVEEGITVPRAADGSASLTVAGTTLRLTQGASKREARLEIVK